MLKATWTLVAETKTMKYIYIPVKSDMFSFFNFCFKYLVKIKNKFSIKNLMSFHGC